MLTWDRLKQLQVQFFEEVSAAFKKNGRMQETVVLFIDSPEAVKALPVSALPVPGVEGTYMVGMPTAFTTKQLAGALLTMTEGHERVYFHQSCFAAAKLVSEDTPEEVVLAGALDILKNLYRMRLEDFVLKKVIQRTAPQALLKIGHGKTSEDPRSSLLSTLQDHDHERILWQYYEERGGEKIFATTEAVEHAQHTDTFENVRGLTVGA